MLITDTSAKEQESKDTKVRKEGHGAFYMLPHYMKLHDILKGAYSNYKVCRHCYATATDAAFCNYCYSFTDGFLSYRWL